ncbi:MAG: hypothetical protein EON58_19340 [Alphaproteobacteria bacterium]|nr:MAG: hypothetical protein EON58_19340 [Alphaproteobacteria bacterium]
MAKKNLHRLLTVTFAAALLVTVAVAAIANSTSLSRAWQQWKTQSDPNHPYSYQTGIRLQTKRNHIDIYDPYRTPSLIQSVDIIGEQDLELRYTHKPGAPSDVLEICSATTKKILLRLGTTPGTQSVVDARWNDIYEVESGSPLNAIPGSVIYCKSSAFDSRSTAIPDLSATPASSPNLALRIVIRPDMSSPLWDWQHRTAMQGKNGRYYLSAFSTSGTSGITSKELAAAIAKNPPHD